MKYLGLWALLAPTLNNNEPTTNVVPMSSFPLSIRILIVDDMERMRTLVKEQVRALGYSNFEYAENGEKAMQMLIQQAHSKPFDLILSDWNMPVVSGLDFLKNVRSNPQFVRVPFLMVTAEADRESVLSAIKAGASNYIVKPFTPSTFDQKLQVIAKNINAVRIST